MLVLPPGSDQEGEAPPQALCQGFVPAWGVEGGGPWGTGEGILGSGEGSGELERVLGSRGGS